jgi:hypothetical protein
VDNCDISKVSGQVSKVSRDRGTEDKGRPYLAADGDATGSAAIASGGGDAGGELLLLLVSW